MSEEYSTEDVILNARQAILEAQKVARHTQDWVIIADRWLNLASFCRQSEASFLDLAVEQVRSKIATIDEVRARLNLPPKED